MSYQLQHLVTDHMAVRIVNFLELIKVDKQHRKPHTAALRHVDSVLHTVEHQCAIRQVGEPVALMGIGQSE